MKWKRCPDVDRNGAQEQGDQGVQKIRDTQQVTESHFRMGGWRFAHKMQNLSMIRKILDFGRPETPQKVSRIPMWGVALHPHMYACGQWKEGEPDRDGELRRAI